MKNQLRAGKGPDLSTGIPLGKVYNAPHGYTTTEGIDWIVSKSLLEILETEGEQ